MDPELDKLESSFNHKIEDWISKQGLIFQLTHITGNGSIVPKIYALCIRLLILSVIIICAFGYYLTKKPSTVGYREDIQKQIQEGLNASDVKVSNSSRSSEGFLTANLSMGAISLGETESSFFEDWFVTEEVVSELGKRYSKEYRNSASIEGIQLSPLGIADNNFSGWSGKNLKIAKLKLKLKTGANTDDLAKTAYSSLFKNYKTLKIDNIQVSDATLIWGNSETTSGSIKGAQLNILKNADSLEINVTGGTFSYAWLKKAKIDAMKVICNRDGNVLIESAQFKIGDGEFKLNASIQIKAMPEVNGEYIFTNVNVIDLVGQSNVNLLSGKIDGKGKFLGKLNSNKSIKTITEITLNANPAASNAELSSPEVKDQANENLLTIRGENIALLKTLQLKDQLHSYSILRTYNGVITIENQGLNTDIDLQDIRCGSNGLILMRGKIGYGIRDSEAAAEDENLSNLKDKENNKIVIDEKSHSELLNEREFSGEIELGITPDVFGDNKKVFEVYPIDIETVRVWFKIPLDGKIEEITTDLADRLFSLMQEDKNKLLNE